MTKKVGRLRNETVYLEYTFSCTFHDKHSPRKSASKHRCMLFSPLSSSHGIFFHFFSESNLLAPGISFTIKGYWKKIIWGYNKIKETPNNIAHSHGVGCVGCCVGWLWKTLATRANYWLAPSFISSNSWHNTTSFEESSVGQVGTPLCIETGTALSIKDWTRLIWHEAIPAALYWLILLLLLLL